MKKQEIIDFFHERVAIMEYDGKLSEQLAKEIAYLYTLQEFVRINIPNLYDVFQSILKDI